MRYMKLLGLEMMVLTIGATLLFGDGPIGYSEQIRVAPDGTIDVVQLDWDDEDDDRFVILGARPFTEQPAEPAPASRA